MSPFGRHRPPQPTDEEMRAAEVDLERIRQGGIPLGAEERLKRVATASTPLAAPARTQNIAVRSSDKLLAIADAPHRRTTMAGTATSALPSASHCR